MSLLTTLTSCITVSYVSINPIIIPREAFFRFGFPFLSNVTFAFLLLTFFSDVVLLLPFIILGLITEGILCILLLSEFIRLTDWWWTCDLQEGREIICTKGLCVMRIAFTNRNAVMCLFLTFSTSEPNERPKRELTRNGKDRRRSANYVLIIIKYLN